MQQLTQPLLSVGKISKTYNMFSVLENVSFTVGRGEKIGLVGLNGAGKTTLLKIISGEIEPGSGNLNFANSKIKIGYIPQDFSKEDDKTVRTFIEDIAGDLSQDYFANLAKLAEFNFDESLLDRRLGGLSGGERSRIALARILMSDYDLYLLDEPTNNLDLEALQTLESFIKKSNRGFIIISHDRRFLDETVNKIFEIDDHTRSLTIYGGNFTDYRTARAVRIENQWREYREGARSAKRLKVSADEKIGWMKKIEKKRADVKRLDKNESEKPEASVLRDKEGRMGIRSKVIRDRYDKKLESIAERPFETLPLRVDLQPEHRSGTKVFEVTGLIKNIGRKNIGPIDLSVQYGDRVLITGDNGVGKTTLLKILTQEISPDGGAIAVGSRVVIGTLPQISQLSKNMTPVEIFKENSSIEESDARKILNRFKLSKEDVSRTIGELSNGEVSRLTLAMMVAKKANCLILDEPSNHLDLEVVEELEQALSRYSGTLVVVSHDRYFIEKIKFSKAYSLEEGILRRVNVSDVY